jgi:hypothetical protein
MREAAGLLLREGPRWSVEEPVDRSHTGREGEGLIE